MADYRAPLDDIRFVMYDVFEAGDLWQNLAGTKDLVDVETADSMLEEAAKMTTGLIGPMWRQSDEIGCTFSNGKVTTPPGYKEAFKAVAEGGWLGLTGNPDYEGMGYPKIVGAQYEEMLYGADMAFGLYSTLTSGAALAIDSHASEELKQKYLPNMYSGRWSGSMCLTEAHAGSDLGIIRTKAVPNDDGTYSITGSKIFISGGENDLAENIIHLVLAKLPGAPAGSKGISLFLVPRNKVDANNVVGENNGVSCGSIEHKMGIKASGTCVMNFDGAQGWLVGEVNRGLAAMFTMMNYERLSVGIQGLAVAERSYQSAVAYAKDRLQGRSPQGAVNPGKDADPLIVHADVRRMLMTMKAYIEGSRAFSTYVARFLDISKFSDNDAEKARAEEMVALMTPVAKAFLTDKGFEACLLGQMIFGGHGYIREWGQEQLVRDCRIAQIYEGTNGIQSHDLLGRKVAADGGKKLEMLLTEIAGFIQSAEGSAAQPYLASLSAAVERLSDATEFVLDNMAADKDLIGAVAVEYLELFGLTVFGYMWAKMVAVAETKRTDLLKSKNTTAAFFFSKLLPKTVSLLETIKAGTGPLMQVDAEAF